MTDEHKEKPETPQTQTTAAEGAPSPCTCVQDPYAALPPELRSRPKSEMKGLRKVTCPGCGLVYWTNRKTDLCMECEKKGVRLPEPETTGG
jgi:hypothetical protein